MTVENENGAAGEETDVLSSKELALARAKEQHEQRVKADKARDILERALDAGKYLLAIYRVEADQVILEFETFGFSIGDYPLAVKMLRDEIQKDVRRLTLKGAGGDEPTQHIPSSD